MNKASSLGANLTGMSGDGTKNAPIICVKVSQFDLTNILKICHGLIYFFSARIILKERKIRGRKNRKIPQQDDDVGRGDGLSALLDI